MSTDLVIKNLHVSVEGQEILKGLDLAINKGVCGGAESVDPVGDVEGLVG